MTKRTPPFKPYPKWTEAKFWSFVRSGLRAKWVRWPPRYEALANARRIYKGKNKRQKYEYKCNICKKYYMQKEVEVDHIIPCGTLKDFSHLATFVENLFVGVDKLQVVCKSCHRSKT